MPLSSSFIPATDNLNLLWAQLWVEECCRQGLEHFFVSPGSRNTPLVLAVARHPKATAIRVYDERGAAFQALGHARHSGKAGVLICTSGSALFNYYPAALEAAQDRIPMLILSADRPPELQACGANQTLPQHNALGQFARWSSSLPCPDLAIAPQYLLSTVAQACFYCQEMAGPVQINMPFREPLAPSPQSETSSAETPFADYLAPLQNWLQSGQPYTAIRPAFADIPAPSLQELLKQLQFHPEGLLLVGRLNRPADQDAVHHLARHLRWPIIADLLSGLRLDAELQTLLPHQDLLLGSASYRQALQPRTILQVGGSFVSGPLLKHLAQLKIPNYISITSGPQQQDPNHQVGMHLQGDLSAICTQLLHHLPPQAGTRWSTPLRQASQIASQLLSEHLEAQPELDSLAVVAAVLNTLPPQSLLMPGNSLPIRLFDTYALPQTQHPLRIVGNRGLSGIDGNLSTAIGLARQHPQPVLLCCGDLTLLHDLNALQAASELKQTLVVLVLNNHGGGIFSLLPVAQQQEDFEPWFGTPHQLNFAGAAQMFGLPYARPESREALETELETALGRAGTSLIEVQTERDGFANWQRDLIAELEGRIQAELSSAKQKNPT